MENVNVIVTIPAVPSVTASVTAGVSLVTNSDETYNASVISGDTLTLPDVPNVDSDGSTVLTPAQTPFICSAPVCEGVGWSPPADWPSIDSLIGAGDDGFVWLVAVFPYVPNYIAFTPQMSASGGTVDWGDGSADTIGTSGTKIEHTFDYANIPGSATSGGYKCAIVKVLFTGVFNSCDFGAYHTNETTTVNNNNQLSLKVASTKTASYFIYTNQRAITLKMLDISNINSVSTNQMLNYHWSLKKLVYDYSKNAVNFSLCHYYCGLDEFDWNSMDWSGITSLALCWFGSRGSIAYALDIDIASCVTLNATFQECGLFSTINLTNTSQVTSIAYAIYNNPSIKSFIMDDASAVTNAGIFIYQYAAYYNSLQRLVLTGLKIGINISYQPMTADNLNEFFTSLGTAAPGDQNIVITGCTGAGSCDTSIATSKGFIIVN